MLEIANRRVNYKLYAIFPLILIPVPLLIARVERGSFLPGLVFSILLLFTGIALLKYLKQTYLVMFDPKENLVAITDSKNTVKVKLVDVLNIIEVSSLSASESLILSPCTKYYLIVRINNNVVEIPFVILDKQKKLLQNYKVLKYKIAELRSERAKLSQRNT